MAVEQYTEHLLLDEMGVKIGDNETCFVLPQGDVSNYPNIEYSLKKAGGKPKKCSLSDFNSGGTGKAKPEFIVTFKNDINTIIVVECKSMLTKH